MISRVTDKDGNLTTAQVDDENIFLTQILNNDEDDQCIGLESMEILLVKLAIEEWEERKRRAACRKKPKTDQYSCSVWEPALSGPVSAQYVDGVLTITEKS